VRVVHVAIVVAVFGIAIACAVVEMVVHLVHRVHFTRPVSVARIERRRTGYIQRQG
jgi:hypothetical protein